MQSFIDILREIFNTRSVIIGYYTFILKGFFEI